MQITQLNDGSCVVQALDAWDSYVLNEDCDYDFPDGTDEPDWWKADLDYDPDERFGWS